MEMLALPTELPPLSTPFTVRCRPPPEVVIVVAAVATDLCVASAAVIVAMATMTVATSLQTINGCDSLRNLREG